MLLIFSYIKLSAQVSWGRPDAPSMGLKKFFGGLQFMYNINEISEIENALLRTAPLEYGKFFDNANSLVSFTTDFYNKVDFNYWLFLGFSAQVQNSLFLAIISTLRRHDVQTNMMLRQALESVVLTCYSAYNKDENDFAQKTSEGLLILNEKVLNKTYKWLEANYKTHSDKIEFMKKHINETSAHSNILHVFQNTDLSQNRRIVTSFFDGNNEDMEHFRAMIKQRLWWIGNIAFGLIDLLSKVITDFKVGKVIDNFPQIMTELGSENQSLMEELKRNPRFSK